MARAISTRIALGLIAGLSLAHAQVRLSDRLIAPEPTGALLCQQIAGARTFSLQIFFDLRGIPNSVLNSGMPHMLEHLIARGKSGTLDDQLESLGCFLKAQTTRQFMRLEISGPAERAQGVIKIAQELFGAFTWSPEQIARERKTMDQERALPDPLGSSSRGLAAAALGAEAIDPAAAVTLTFEPTQLQQLLDVMQRGPRVVVAYAGPNPPDAAMPWLRELSAALPKEESVAQFDLAPSYARMPIGGFVGFRVNDMLEPQGAARIAACILAASLHSDFDLLWTPTSGVGTCGIGFSGAEAKRAGFETLDSMTPDVPRGARAAATNWIRRGMASPSGAAYWLGALRIVGPITPETLIDAFAAPTDAQIQRAWDELRAMKSGEVTK